MSGSWTLYLKKKQPQGIQYKKKQMNKQKTIWTEKKNVSEIQHLMLHEKQDAANTALQPWATARLRITARLLHERSAVEHRKCLDPDICDGSNDSAAHVSVGVVF